jgi:hypothetical protein
MYTPAAEGGGSVQVFMLNYCLGINTAFNTIFHNSLLIFEE